MQNNFQGDKKKMNSIEQNRIEDFIKTLKEEELLYMNRLIVSRLNLITQEKSTKALARFNIGEMVEFTDTNGLVQTGRIIRLNKKTAGIEISGGHQWNVSPHLLRAARVV